MNCLRCGRTAEASFCPECLKTVGQPLVESPYLNTQINLNAQRMRRPAPPIQTAFQEKKAHNHRGYIFTIILLSVLCAVLLCACLWLGAEDFFS